MQTEYNKTIEQMNMQRESVARALKFHFDGVLQGELELVDVWKECINYIATYNPVVFLRALEEYDNIDLNTTLLDVVYAAQSRAKNAIVKIVKVQNLNKGVQINDKLNQCCAQSYVQTIP